MYISIVSSYVNGGVTYSIKVYNVTLIIVTSLVK